ncbi:hypothetical protein GCM10027427_12080 [Pseudoclavibacter terrae]
MKPKFVPNRAGIEAALKSETAKSVVRQGGNTIAKRAGPGFEVDVKVGTRARANVTAKTAEARRRQSRDHVLERAVGGGA